MGQVCGRLTDMEWTPPEPRLEVGDLALRPFEAHDALAVVDACRDADILRFTFMKDGLTEAEAAEWIVARNERWSQGHPVFAIVGADDDRLLGEVGLNFNPRHVSGEAHYWVGPSERRRGVASKALSLVIDWGFSKGIERIFLVIHPENGASNGLALKLGFVREGELRSYEPIKGHRACDVRAATASCGDDASRVRPGAWRSCPGHSQSLPWSGPGFPGPARSTVSAVRPSASPASASKDRS